jgi:hypothetical protein
MNDTLQDTRLKAAQLEELQRAAARLPELEAAAERQAIADRAQERLGDLVPVFNSGVVAFRSALEASNGEVADALAVMARAVERRRSVGRRAAELRTLANEIASAQLMRNRPGEPPTMQTRDDLARMAQQLLIDQGFGGARLMVLPMPDGDVEQALANTVCGLTGDVVPTDPRDLLGGPVCVSEYDPRVGANVDRWL